MREGITDEKLYRLIEKAVKLKPTGHEIDEETAQPSFAERTMTQIGG